MAYLVFSHPWVLWLLPLSLLPLLLSQRASVSYAWLDILPHDRLSDSLGKLLKIAAVLVLLGIILALSTPHSTATKIERVGTGAQIALVLDRSASMDDPFAGQSGQVGEIKSGAASRLITDFVKAREHDLLGMVSFSNSAMYVLPLTESKEAITAAVAATSGNALFQTNIGSGLTSAVELFEHVPNSGSRAVILLSDGAGRIDAQTQQKIKDWYERFQLGLYWIVLRQPGGLSIFDKTFQPKEDQPLPPEIELFSFFNTLRSPFKAYEAENPQTLKQAINDINSREKKIIHYTETIPGTNYTVWCLYFSALMTSLLIGLKLLELSAWRKL